MSVRKIFWPLVALTLFGLAATQARAQDRCSGTLCDFYYGNKPAAPAQAAAPQAPAPQARQAPQDPNRPSGGYLMDMFSGGGSAAAQPGAPAPQDRRCEGTLCDLYYGKSTEREAAWPNEPPPQATQAPAPMRAATGAAGSRYRADPSAPDLNTEAESGFVERPQPTFCASTKADPWKCYK